MRLTSEDSEEPENEDLLYFIELLVGCGVPHEVAIAWCLHLICTGDAVDEVEVGPMQVYLKQGRPMVAVEIAKSLLQWLHSKN